MTNRVQPRMEQVQQHLHQVFEADLDQNASQKRDRPDASIPVKKEERKVVSTTNLKSFLTSQNQERGARAELRELHYGSKDGVPLAKEIKRDNLDVVEGPEMQIEFLSS